MPHFFAYLSRMRFINRWGLMHNTYPENIQEHSLRVAMISHALAMIRNRVFGGAVNSERTAVLARYHDASEVPTEDPPAPVKNFNPQIETAYTAIEASAGRSFARCFPTFCKSTIAGCSRPTMPTGSTASWSRPPTSSVRTSSAWRRSAPGTRNSRGAEEALAEVGYSLDTLVPSFRMTLDELE